MTTPVHPHVRGEYFGKRGFGWHDYGSPPRAWGIHVQVFDKYTTGRFTPTCVGNTYAIAGYGVPPPVHPHVRGEYH